MLSLIYERLFFQYNRVGWGQYQRDIYRQSNPRNIIVQQNYHYDRWQAPKTWIGSQLFPSKHKQTDVYITGHWSDSSIFLTLPSMLFNSAHVKIGYSIWQQDSECLASFERYYQNLAMTNCLQNHNMICIKLEEHKTKTEKELRAIVKAQASNLARRLQTKMLLMKPVLTYTALYHLYLFFYIRIRIGATACAIWTFEIMIIRILSILYVFVWKNLAEELPKFWISTVTPKVSLGPQLYNLVAVEQQKASLDCM